MRAVHIQKYGRMPVLTQTAIPSRPKGQLLIKMKYAPVNPSDVFFYLGRYGIRKDGFPIMGLEGSGVITESEQEELKGRRVSVFANKNNGTYAEYMVSSLNEVIVWPNELVPNEQDISMAMVNPISVLALTEVVRSEKAQTVVVSAATSNTSKMIMKFLKKHHPAISVLGMSRSEKYDQQLKDAGFNALFRMEQTGQLKKQLQHHGKTVFLDCVGGNFAGQVFNTLPFQSVMVNYGRLSKEDLGAIDLGQLYYQDKRIRGFWLTNYLKECGKDRLVQIKQDVIDNREVFRQKIRQVLPVESYELAIRESIKNQSEGKVLLDLSS